jgi:hypothetical protein
MPIGIKKPTGKGVRDLHMKLIREWDARFSVDEDLRDLIHQDNIIEVLDESEDKNMKPVEIHSGRAGGIIEHANGLLMARPSFHAEPPTLNTEDAREAEAIERAAMNVFERELILNDFWPSVGRDVLSYGRAFIKSMPLPDVWTTEQGYPVREQKETSKEYLEKIRVWKDTEGAFPFVIQHVPALSILPLLDNNDKMLASIEQKYVTAKILAEEMGSKNVQEMLERRTLNWYDELPIIEYIDTEWVAYLLAGTEPRSRGDAGLMQTAIDDTRRITSYTLLRAWRHGLGKHPVVIIPGIRTELSEYDKHFKSFLSDAKEALEVYDWLLSRLATMVWSYFLPSYVWNIPATTTQFSGRDRPIIKVNLGGVTTVYADEELDVLPIPQNLPDATLLLTQTDDIIQRHTLEDVLFGRVQGAAPAYQVNLRINVAKSKLSPIAQHMAIGITEVIDLFLRGIERLGEAVVIQGERITTSTAKKYRARVTASITPKSPIDRNQDIGAANMALQFGLPWRWIVENILDVEDPATLQLQKDIEELENLPPIKERLMQDALEQLEALIEEDELQDLDNIDLSQLPPEAAEALSALVQGPSEEGAGEGSPEGLGRGPFPEGAAPQSLAPRGLGTPNRQPQPGSPQTGTEEIL